MTELETYRFLKLKSDVLMAALKYAYRPSRISDEWTAENELLQAAFEWAEEAKKHGWASPVVRLETTENL
jgi:hypothetical protein